MSSEIRDPIAMFMKEHDEALVQLQLMKRAAQSLKKSFSEDAFVKMVKSAEFIDDEVRVHNAKEEDLLFTVIEKYEDGVTQVMRDDHQRMSKIYKKLRQSIEQLQENRKDRVARVEMVEAADEIVHLMVNHIHKENLTLFPRIQKYLSKDELRMMAKRLLV